MVYIETLFSYFPFYQTGISEPWLFHDPVML